MAAAHHVVDPSEVVDSFFKVMRRYREAGVVFTSPVEAAYYAVQSVDDGRCDILRLNPNTTTPCTAAVVIKLWAYLQAMKGAAAPGAFDSNRAQFSAFMQNPYVALDVDGQTLLDVSDREAATQLLAKLVKQMRVDKSSGSPKLYKPAMLAAVIDAIEVGDLKRNELTYDVLMPRFVDRLARLGVDVDDNRATSTFFHLSSEPFWLLAYFDPEKPIRTSKELSPAILNKSVRYAVLKEPFWELLQVPAYRHTVSAALAAAWWPTVSVPMKLNQELLHEAVEKSIRPLLIEQKRLEDPKKEGYHHLKIIPRAKPNLTIEALDADPIEHVRDALAACKNLLSSFEQSWASALLDRCDPDEAREHFRDLLHGDDGLVDRVRRFVEWGGKRKARSGKKFFGFTSTAVSYLLAVSAPERYAFCKPEVYDAAATALLGDEHVKRDSAEQIAHATEFYLAALKLFRDVHRLPFVDLMHTHIAFFVMKESYEGYPDWEMLMKSTPNSVGGKKNPSTSPSRAVNHPLNIILYGPPGTGKTHETVRLAVEICDDTVAEDREQVVERFRQLQEEKRVAFVTFHQSYGYEDFIEGIRPVLVNSETESGEEAASGGEVRYVCRDGVFKKIALLARGSSVKAGRATDVDLSSVQIWKMSLGDALDPDQSLVFEESIAGNQLLLGYGKGLDFTGSDTPQAILAKLQSVEPSMKPDDFNVRSVNMFKNRMDVGDLVVISHGNLKFRAIGRVTGEYAFDANRDSYQQTRPVEWLFVAEESLPCERILRKKFQQQAIYQLGPQSVNVTALREFLTPAVAAESEPPKYVLVIDEINRGNIAKIMGELITLLEPDKRIGGKNGLRITLPYSGTAFGVPGNLHVIGTMNTADRSIAFLDAALRRRFRFQEVMPSSDVVRELVGSNGDVGGVDIAAMLAAINDRIELIFDRDHQIGHSYFLDVANLSDVRDVFVTTVIPLLQEYFYGDWSKLCLVLGCPYDSEGDGMETPSRWPLITAKRLTVEGLLGGGHDDVSDRLRYTLNPAFLSASNEQLSDFFNAIGELVVDAELSSVAEDEDAG